MAGYSIAQERALAVMPKVMSSCSIPCSMFIIYEVFCDYRTRGTTPIQRALVGMSLVDMMASTGWFLSTWAVPEGSFAFAAGNRNTCNFQGFLLQLAIGAPLYNSSLALFYLLMIKQRWTDEQLMKIERWVHFFILTFTVGTSILLLRLEQYNHIGAVCWVIGEPAGCGNSSYQGSDVPCERGNHAWAWGLALFYGPLWVCVIACVSSMVVLYLEVRNTHRRSRRHSVAIGMQHSLNRSGSDSSRVAVQAILYSLSFVVTWMPSTLWSIAHWFSWGHYGLDIAAAIAEPLQGFWNMLIFLKSRPKSVLKVRTTLSQILPCIFSPPSDFDPHLSFATGLRQGRYTTNSNISGQFPSTPLGNVSSNHSGNFSSGHLADPFHSKSNTKQAHRNTASTEALDELKGSVDDLDCDISGFGDRDRKPDCLDEADEDADSCDDHPRMSNDCEAESSVKCGSSRAPSNVSVSSEPAPELETRQEHRPLDHEGQARNVSNASPQREPEEFGSFPENGHGAPTPKECLKEYDC